jgi:uncharacterized protein
MPGNTSPDPPQDLPQSEHLCVGCGACCNGVVFFWVSSSPEEEEKLRPLLPALQWVEGENRGFHQPCPYYAGCCTAYADRPETCRKFRCKTLISLEAGEISFATASARTREVREATQALLEASGCSTVAEVLKILRHGPDEVPAEAPVPPFSFEMLILQRLIDLHIRDEGDAWTMGKPAADETPTPPAA